jgi:hypothetical protein
VVAWVTVVIVVRELGITVWRMILARKGKVVPASKGGKLKTVLADAGRGDGHRTVAGLDRLADVPADGPWRSW